MRCEGYTRRGGIMTFGKPTWHQCENKAIVNIKFKQKEEDIATLPGCKECWQKCIDSKSIEILSTEPIKEDS